MIGLVMAGGKGSRMSLPEEKLVLKYKKPLILHVIEALKNSNCFSKIVVATNANSPKTKNLLKTLDIEILETQGNGFSEDLNFALQSLNDHVLIVAGDLPLLDGHIIKQLVKQSNDKTWTSFLVTKKFLDLLGLKSDYTVSFDEKECIYTGISLVNAKDIVDFNKIKENFLIIDDKRIAFNINTKEEYDLLANAQV